MRLTPAEFARLMGDAGRRLPGAVARAERESLADHLNTARQYSMGPYSSAQLAAMGHPYSRRNPHPPQDPAIINLQSGEFLAGWETLAQQRAGDALRTAAINTAPYSGYLDQGTRLMIRRPQTARVAQTCHQRRVARIAEATGGLIGDEP